MAARRPRWWLRILAVVAALGLLAGAAELALRLIIPGVIGNAVRGEFGMTSDHPVEVELGGSAVLYALTGRVGQVSVTVPDAPVIDGIAVTVRAHADSAPFDLSAGEIEGGTASVTVPQEQLGPVIALLTRGVADSGEVVDGQLQLGRTVQILGLSVPLELTLDLSVAGGEVLVEPTSVGAVGFDLTVEQMRSAVGTSLDGVLTTHAVCVNDRLPRGVSLTSIDLSSTGSVTVSAELSPRILSDPAELEYGVCGETPAIG